MPEKITLKGLKTPISSKQLTIGCDPEFELVSRNNQVVSTGTGYPHGNYPYEENRFGQIGSDCGNVELHPKPSTSPKTVVNNTGKLIGRFYQKSGLRLSVLSNKFCVGGHIHIGISPEKLKIKIVESYIQNGYQFHRGNTDLLRMLDCFLGKRVRPLCGSARINNGYSKLSGHRLQPHGLEYRVPPAAIFYNKKLLTMCFTLAKLIVKKFFEMDTITVSPNPTKEEYKEILGLSDKFLDEFHNEIRKVKKIMKSRKEFLQPVLHKEVV